MTESTNINSLADHHMWSTIKTLPATLPELRTVDHGPRPAAHPLLIKSKSEAETAPVTWSLARGGFWLTNLIVVFLPN